MKGNFLFPFIPLASLHFVTSVARQVIDLLSSTAFLSPNEGFA